MTAAERLLRRRVIARAARLQPQLSTRLVRAYDLLRRVLPERTLTRAVESGQLERLVMDLLDDSVMDPALRPLKEAIDQGVLQAARAWAGDLPPGIRGVGFNILNPRIIDAIETLDHRVIEGVKKGVRDTFREVVADGLRAGDSPAAISRDLRGLLDLAPNQAKAVRNFRRMLRDGDPEALTRSLRDRRFDATVKRAVAGAKLPRQQVDRMVEAYARRMASFNAATHAHSAALGANKVGQRASWLDAIDRGVIEASDLVRVWVTVGDDRVREDHVAMDGEEAAFDAPYSNGETVPGESTYNCRCIERVEVRGFRPPTWRR